MARKLSQAELDRMKADFDAPEVLPVKQDQQQDDQQPKRRGNPNGRPPSENPRLNNLHIRLSDEDAETLNEAARLTKKTKTAVIIEGINLVYNNAAAEAWKQTSAEFKDHQIKRK